INRAQKATVLMVTHDETAASYCRRVLFIRDGKVFTELVRGADTRRQFFEKIMQVVAVEGGVDNAR
ncbi:MAG: ABC transporter ATP-binding protein, partial [Atopobiaceae bacterium]